MPEEGTHCVCVYMLVLCVRVYTHVYMCVCTHVCVCCIYTCMYMIVHYLCIILYMCMCVLSMYTSVKITFYMNDISIVVMYHAIFLLETRSSLSNAIKDSLHNHA